MLKKLFSLLWLLVEVGCATAGKTFQPIENCVPSLTQVGVFSCVPTVDKPYDLQWTDSRDLECFHAKDFKVHEETCHQ